MTHEMQAMLEREMQDALALTDPSRRADAVQTVTLHYLSALTDCQRKTSERVKELLADRDRLRTTASTVNWLGRAVYGFAAAGGFAVLVKVFKAWGFM